jgi:hypothetical protein
VCEPVDHVAHTHGLDFDHVAEREIAKRGDALDPGEVGSHESSPHFFSWGVVVVQKQPDDFLALEI